MSLKSALKIVFSISVALAFYYFRDGISDDSTHAFLMAICSGIVTFSFFAWGELAGDQEIAIGPKIKIKTANLIYGLFSFLFAYLVLKNYCSYFFDDTAFTLRYLDNFRDGYFYHYNKLDPPVFGISSFVYGLFTGFWCWTHILTPEQSVHYTSYLGTILLGFLVFKMLRELVKESGLIFILWFSVMFNSKMFLNVIPSGIESPFHVSILFAAILFFLQNKSKWMWFFLALSVISKLDAVPFACVTGLIYLLIHRTEIFPLNFKNKMLLEIVFFVLIPLGAYVIFTSLVFGSPLPQSAYAKIFFHAHSSDYWFPFLTYYVKEGAKVLVFWIFCGLFSAHIIFAIITGFTKELRRLVFGFSFLATLVLFYFYNPGEKMQWYYVLPDLLLSMQLVVSFYTIVSLVPYKILRHILSGTAFFYFIGFVGTDIIGGKYWMDAYLDNVERERKEIGLYIGDLVGEKDSMLSNHALVSRHVKGYVIDMSGLNSRFATNYRLNMDSMIDDHHPRWGIYHTSAGYAELMSRKGYSPVRTFYDITNYAYPEWTLFKRNDNVSQHTLFAPLDSAKIKRSSVVTEGGILRFTSDSLVMLTSGNAHEIKSVSFGVKRDWNPFVISIAQYKGDSLLSLQNSEIKMIKDYPKDSKYTEALVIQLIHPDVSKISIFAAQKGKSFTLIDPYLTTKR